MFGVAVPRAGRGPRPRLPDAQPELDGLGIMCRAVLVSGPRGLFRLRCVCPGARSLTGSGVVGGCHVSSVPSGLARAPLPCFVPPAPWENTDQFLRALHLAWLCRTFPQSGQSPRVQAAAASCPHATRCQLSRDPPAALLGLPSASLPAHEAGSRPVISEYLIGRCLHTV